MHILCLSTYTHTCYISSEMLSRRSFVIHALTKQFEMYFWFCKAKLTEYKHYFSYCELIFKRKKRLLYTNDCNGFLYLCILIKNLKYPVCTVWLNTEGYEGILNNCGSSELLLYDIFINVNILHSIFLNVPLRRVCSTLASCWHEWFP